MHSLARLRSDRYSSSSGGRLSGPLLQSYHGSPKYAHSRQHSRSSPSTAALLSRLVMLLLVVGGCFVGGKYVLHRRGANYSSSDASATTSGFLPLVSLAGRGSSSSGSGSSTSTGFWPSPSDFNSFKIPRPTWAGGSASKKDAAASNADAAEAAAAKALKGTRVGRLFEDNSSWGSSKEAARGGLGSVEVDSKQQQLADAPAPPLPPSAVLSNQQQQQQSGGVASTDDALLASSDVQAVQTPPSATATTRVASTQGAPATSNTASSSGGAGAADADALLDPLHDNQSDAEKEAEQLSALTRVIQQQQETIEKQAGTLQELQKRFEQQEHQLVAATASASASNGSEGVQVEPYFPEDKVQQELSMLHKVEAQIDAVAKSVDDATKALPNLTREQQIAQLAELERADQLMSRLSRVAAAINLRTSDPLTESGHDPVVELRHYYGTVANNITMDWKAALDRQSRPSAEALGLSMDPFTDGMSDLDTLDLRLEYVAAMMKGMHDAAPCRLGLVTTWSGDLWGLRKELVPWITYHAYLGVSRLYVLYEGRDPRTLRELMALKPWVTVTLASAPLATRQEVAHYDAWVNTVPDAHIKEWKSQPGNYHLMTKQGYAVTTALQMARTDNVTWLMHLDPDELLHPGASHAAGMLAGSYSLLPELCNAPAHVPSIRFVNVEGVPEAADIANRYEQVTLFRAHRHLVPPQIQPFRYIFKQGHADAWLHLYTNGKSAVRPDAPGVTQGGPHVFLGPADKRWATPDNPHGIWRPTISNSTLVLHYAYATPGDVAVKAGRSCPPGVVEAVLAGNTSQAAQCFVLDLDQRAFLAAVKDRIASGLGPVPATSALDPAADTSSRTSSGPIVVDPATYFGSSTSNGFSNSSWPVGQHVRDFFWGELTLSEGAPFECLTPDGKSTGWCAMKDVDKLKSLLISSGLMMRLHAPAQTMKGIETAIQQLMLLGHRRASDKAIPEIVMASPAQAADSAMQAAAAAAAATATATASSAAASGAANGGVSADAGQVGGVSGGQETAAETGAEGAAGSGASDLPADGTSDATAAVVENGEYVPYVPRWGPEARKKRQQQQQQQQGANIAQQQQQPAQGAQQPQQQQQQQQQQQPSQAQSEAQDNEATGASPHSRAWDSIRASRAAAQAAARDDRQQQQQQQPGQQQPNEAGSGSVSGDYRQRRGDRPDPRRGDMPANDAAGAGPDAAAAGAGAGAVPDAAAAMPRRPAEMRAWFDQSNRPRGTYGGPGDGTGGLPVGYRAPPRGYRGPDPRGRNQEVVGGGRGGPDSGVNTVNVDGNNIGNNGRRLQQQPDAGVGSGPSGSGGGGSGPQQQQPDRRDSRPGPGGPEQLDNKGQSAWNNDVGRPQPQRGPPRYQPQQQQRQQVGGAAAAAAAAGQGGQQQQQQQRERGWQDAEVPSEVVRFRLRN